jgi:N-hydroxyarylamine O-acetyltransferase
MNLDAYLERIGLQSRPSLAEVHRAHVTSIPFENLDPHGGKAVSLQPADL